MLRRLLLGYLGLLLVVLVAFGVPFGILWASHARSDEVSALQQSASEAAASVAPPLRAAFVADRASKATGTLDQDEDGDGIVAGLRLAPAEKAAVTNGLAPFMSAPRSLVALVDGNRKVLVSLGPDRLAGGSVLPPAGLDLLDSSGKATSGEVSVGSKSFLYAAALVRAPVAEPTEPGVVKPTGDAQGIPVGVVVLAEPSQVVADRVRTIAASLAALGASILVLAALAGWALVRSLVRPLKQIEAAVAELGGGDLDARAPTGRGPVELIELAETVNVMAAQLGELITAQRAFVADASHQLRTPLTALRLRLESLPAGEPTPPEELGAILAEVERLSRLVTGLLGLARAEEAPLPPVPTDVAELLGARGEAWQSVAEEQGVTLAVDVPGPLEAMAVAEDLEQAVDNLLDNALRVAPAGSTVRLVAAEEDDQVALHVVDEGPGMDPDDRLHAFDRFWTRRTEQGQGSGLGLAIVSRLVHHSGGEVALLDSPTGRGIDAVIWLRPA